MIVEAVLAFTICGAADPASPGERCEQGTLTARSCQAAEAWVRAGLRPGQELHLSGCTVTTREARR